MDQQEPDTMATTTSTATRGRRKRRHSLQVASLFLPAERQRQFTYEYHQVNLGGGLTATTATAGDHFPIFQVPQHYHHRHDTRNNAGEAFQNDTPTTAVTFGVYHDEHNDQVIPELIQANVVSVATPLQQQRQQQPNEQQHDIEQPPSSEEEDPNHDDNDHDEMDSPKTPANHVMLVLQKWLCAMTSTHYYVMPLLAANAACWLTYALLQTHPELDPQIVTQILVTLCGAICPHVITAVACGVYSGAVQVLVSQDNDDNPSDYTGIWILVLGLFTSLAWQLLIHRYKVALGLGGRLGFTSFVAMNATALLAAWLDPNLDTLGDMYYNPDAFSSDSMVWEAVLSTASCVVLAWVSGWVRLRAKVPVNPVFIPSAYALLFMLATYLLLTTNDNDNNNNDTSYETFNILDGYAVGAYVGMSGLNQLTTSSDFAMAGLLAGGFLQLLRPVFGGFGGKSGTTALLGVVAFKCWKQAQRQCCGPALPTTTTTAASY